MTQGLFGSFSSDYGMCCPPVFDPYTLLALLGGIALATFFLRLVIIGTMFGRRSFSDDFFGKIFCLKPQLCHYCLGHKSIGTQSIFMISHTNYGTKNCIFLHNNIQY